MDLLFESLTFNPRLVDGLDLSGVRGVGVSGVSISPTLIDIKQLVGTVLYRFYSWKLWDEEMTFVNDLPTFWVLAVRFLFAMLWHHPSNVTNCFVHWQILTPTPLATSSFGSGIKYPAFELLSRLTLYSRNKSHSSPNQSYGTISNSLRAGVKWAFLTWSGIRDLGSAVSHQLLPASVAVAHLSLSTCLSSLLEYIRGMLHNTNYVTFNSSCSIVLVLYPGFNRPPIFLFSVWWGISRFTCCPVNPFHICTNPTVVSPVLPAYNFVHSNLIACYCLDGITKMNLDRDPK